jgi:YaiO family outer membrane protein
MRMLILSLLALTPAYAQVENALTQARDLVKNDHPDQAISLLNEYLVTEPEDLDARVLLGLIYSWNQRWADGRRAFSVVLRNDQDYKDAVLGLINLEIWSGHPTRAQELVQHALAARPDDSDLKLAQSKIEVVLTPAQTVSPDGRKDSAPAPDEPSWETGVAASTIFFSDKRSTWHETAVNMSRNFTAGWVTATFSHVNWFGKGSNMIDLQSYPRIRHGTYGFIDVAISPDATLYSRRRAGAEIFQNLPHGYEFSAGIRYLRFTNNVILYTGTFGKYFGNYWILGRTFIEPDSTTPGTTSYQVLLRRFYGDPDHYIGLRLGEGPSPFEVESLKDLGIQRSYSGAFETLWKFKNQMRLRATGSIARQTRLYTGPLWQYEADLTLYLRY